MWLSFGLSYQSKASIVVDDPIKDRGETSSNKPRCIIPVVKTSTFADYLNLGVSYYVGNIQILVFSNENECCFSESYNVNGSNSITVDFSSYNTGIYTIGVVFENGMIYMGSVTKN